jgi:hypothetical protein
MYLICVPHPLLREGVQEKPEVWGMRYLSVLSQGRVLTDALPPTRHRTLLRCHCYRLLSLSQACGARVVGNSKQRSCSSWGSDQILSKAGGSHRTLVSLGSQDDVTVEDNARSPSPQGSRCKEGLLPARVEEDIHGAILCCQCSR